MAPPRIAFPGTVMLVTTRVQAGLPFVCNQLMELIVYSSLARAQKVFPVIVCHFIVMGNHVHLLIVVKNPNDFIGFMDHFKTETAHAINRLLGRRQISVWCDSFHAAPILKASDVVREIAYIYSNPSTADLEDTIESYPGVSSWAMYQEKRYVRKCHRIRRPAITKLKKTDLTYSEAASLAESLKATSKSSHMLKIDPNAWMALFDITDKEQIDGLNEEILSSLRARELEARESRVREKRRCLGRERLMNQPMDLQFSPKKFGEKMWCICSDKERRIEFINFVKALLSKAHRVYLRWKQGDYSVPYPIGLFPPSLPRIADLVPPVFA